MLYTGTTFPNTDYSVNGLNSDMGSFPSSVSASVIPADTKRPTPDHRKFINFNLISLNILFDAGKDTLPSCSVDKILGVFWLWGLNLLPCVVLFHSLDSNNPTFIQTKNVIWPRLQ